ncbi:MAG: FliA/WhiG family RNA polymerase sigma factor [Lachnotalea sp.]
MDEAGKLKLWEDYAKDKSPGIREQIIIEYAPLVKIVAGRLSIYLGHSVEYDDLVGYGVFGLIDAIDKFDCTKMVKFETYASLRIRGAILDEMRKMDWIPRTVRQKQKKIELATREVESRTGKEASEEEIAKEIGIDIDELEDWRNKTKVTNIISLDEFLEKGSEASFDNRSKSNFELPETKIEMDEVKKILGEALETLTDKEKKVVLLYYYEELTLKEISRILEVSESRISQLHTKAIQKMKIKLGKYFDILINI